MEVQQILWTLESGHLCVDGLSQLNSKIFICSVITGGSDGIGKAYARNVRITRIYD